MLLPSPNFLHQWTIVDLHGRFSIFPPGGYERILQFYWLTKFLPLTLIGWVHPSRSICMVHFNVYLTPYCSIDYVISLRKLYLWNQLAMICYVWKAKWVIRGEERLLSCWIHGCSVKRLNIFIGQIFGKKIWFEI